MKEKRGKRKEGSRCDGRFLKLFLQFYLNPNRMTAACAFRMACNAWIKVSAGVPMGTLRQCRLELNRISPEVITLSREWRQR